MPSAFTHKAKGLYWSQPKPLLILCPGDLDRRKTQLGQLPS